MKDKTLLRRFMARNIDYMLWIMFLNLSNYLIFNIYEPVSLVKYIAFGSGLFFIVEFLFLYFLKRTPGKMALGLEIEMEFNLKNCLKRSLFSNGLGMVFGAMIFSQIVWVFHLVYYKKTKKTIWDNIVQSRVQSKDISSVKVFLMVASFLLLGQISNLVPKPNTLDVKDESLVNSFHQEKEMKRVDTIYFSPDYPYSIYSEACVLGAVEYAKSVNKDLNIREASSYCFNELSTRNVKKFDPKSSKYEACAVGVSYSILKLSDNENITPPKEVGLSEEKFYVDFCEKSGL